jgi:hypothetical protein
MGAGLGKALSAACFSNDVLLLALKAGETDVVAEVNGACSKGIPACMMDMGTTAVVTASELLIASQHLEAHPNAATGSLSVRDGNSAFHVSAGKRWTIGRLIPVHAHTAYPIMLPLPGCVSCLDSMKH